MEQKQLHAGPGALFELRCYSYLSSTTPEFGYSINRLLFLQQLLDFLRRVSRALVDPGTLGAGLFPVGWSLDDLAPERECPALRGSNRIDLAALVEENAVAVGAFDQAELPMHLAHILAGEFAVIHSQHFRDAVKLRDCEPDIPRAAGAAMSALCAFEFQTICVPRHSHIVTGVMQDARCRIAMRSHAVEGLAPRIRKATSYELTRKKRCKMQDAGCRMQDREEGCCCGWIGAAKGKTELDKSAGRRPALQTLGMIPVNMRILLLVCSAGLRPADRVAR